MEYKDYQIPDVVEKIDTYTLGKFSGDSDSWEVSPEEIETMLSDANCIARERPYNLVIHSDNCSRGGSVLIFDAVVSRGEETDEERFERIADQMAIIDKVKIE